MAEAGAESQTVQEYIVHHLSYLTYGRHPDGHWGLAHTPEEAAEMGFMAIHVDTMGWSIALGAAFLLWFRWVGLRASADNPGPIQNFVESVFEFVDARVTEGFTHKNSLIGPLALTVFVWILLMNTMDLVPVDWITGIAAWIGEHVFGFDHMPFKIVPTTDPNITMGMSLSVFLLIIWYSIQHKGIGGFLGELAFHPFGKWMMPFNLMIEIPTLLGQAHLPRIAAVRQSVRGGTVVSADSGLAGTMAATGAFRLGGIPHPGGAVAGFRIHDADHCLSQCGA